jgi:tetratricopeptide (TPR) repeat protein
MALYCLERSAGMAQRLSDWSLLARTRGNLGFVYLCQHQVAEASAVFHELLLRAAEIGDRRSVARQARLIGRCHQHFGDVPTALRCYALQVAMGLELGERRDMSVGIGFVASAYAQQGDFEQAGRVGELAVALCDSIRLVYWGCEFRQDLARLRFAEGRLDEAEALNEEALDTARRLGSHRLVQLNALLLQARMRVLRGELAPDEAIAALGSLDEDWFSDRELAAIQYARWQIAPTRDDLRAAAAQFYARLATAHPTLETLARYEELAGAAAPALPPLPPLPELITRRPYDLAALIEQAESLVNALA